MRSGSGSLYLDANVVFSLLVDEPSTDRAESFLRRRAEPLIVSDFAAAELLSAVARRVRMRELTSAQGQFVLSRVDLWLNRSANQIEIGPGDIAVAAAFLRRLDLPLRTPDAIHIAISQRLDSTLVTFDRRMGERTRAGHGCCDALRGCPVRPKYAMLQREIFFSRWPRTART